MAGKTKVLAMDHSPDMLSLLELMLDELGYETETVLMDVEGEAVAEKAEQFEPDVIVMDLVPTHSADLALLDRLRVEPSTRAEPVIALSTDISALGEAVASYNVRQVLQKPFDLDELEEKLRAAVENAPIIALFKSEVVPPKPLFAEVATELAAHSRTIITRWVQQISAIEVYRQRVPHIIDKIDHVPPLLAATLMALQIDDFRRVFERDPEVRERIADHARARHRQGIPLVNAAKEKQLLRNEIWCDIAGILQGKKASEADVLEMATRIDFVLDATLTMTIEIYEEKEPSGEEP